MDLQESLIRFNKFLQARNCVAGYWIAYCKQDNETKKHRAIKRYQEEQRAFKQKERDLLDLQDQYRKLIEEKSHVEEKIRQSEKVVLGWIASSFLSQTRNIKII